MVVDQSTLPRWMTAFEPLVYAGELPEATGIADIVDRIGASPEVADPFGARPVVLNALKSALDRGRSILEGAFMASNDGAAYVGGHSLLMDRLIRLIHDRAMLALDEPSRPDLAILATGGYGRGELCPHSDIDLLFLTRRKADAKAVRVIEYILYMLWDLGLNIGHASRTPMQAIQTAKSDITVRTALLEARYLTGSRQLADELMDKFKRVVMQDTALSFIDAKLKERDERHRRSDARRYMLEPNIKEGKGGLRDLHTLFWIARYAYKATSVSELIRFGVLSSAEARAFSSAQQFFWTLRCQMHLRSGREDDRLTFDAQMDIAPRLGYVARRAPRGDSQGGKTVATEGVERFMRRYFLAATTAGNMTRIFCAAIADTFSSNTRTIQDGRNQDELPPPFVLQGGRIALADKTDFANHPHALIGIFKLSLDRGLDIHPNALRRMTRKLNLIDDGFRKRRLPNTLFLELLTHEKSCERALRLMNEVGVLGKFLPDFGRIVAMMQYDMYHSYTVDEHTIFAVGVLNQIERGELVDIAPLASRAVHEIAGRTELYVALLLHDIAKGRGADHSELGAGIARQICARLGLDAAMTETVFWLVRWHLLMSETAFRYDLNDPAIINRFAEAVQSPERLNLLLVLTVADIRAVGPNVWNGWKAVLMRELYHRTMAVLLGGDASVAGEESANDVRAGLADDLRALDEPWSQDTIERHIQLFPPDYWASFDRPSYPRHAVMLAAFEASGDEVGIFLTPDEARGATELVVIATDATGLFSRIAGGIAACGANIVDARITTRKDGLALDVLWLQSDDRQAVTDHAQLAEARRTLMHAVTGKLDIDREIEQRPRQMPLRIRRITAPARVLVNNRISLTHTVIEINGKDTPGLLYRVTRAMARLELKIEMASVSTYGDRVVDVFYVKDAGGLKIEHNRRIKTIHKTLLRVLEDSDAANQVAA